MVDWLAGNRVRGTSTERTSTTGFNDGFTGVGGWKEVGRTTLGSAGDTISVTSLADKRYYMVLGNYIPTGGNVNGTHRYNNDSGSNYANRYSDNGGADGTGISSTEVWCNPQEDDHHLFGVSYIGNKSDKEKLVLFNGVNANSTGAANAPARRETSGKWTNTSSAINRIDAINTDAGSFNTNSEVVVLGWDPADTHTTNFWEELASVDWSSGGNMDTGSFSAKKYLWIQGYGKQDGTSGWSQFLFNNDTTTYATRSSADGGSDTTVTSQSEGSINRDGSASQLEFFNMFVINNSANEKLAIIHSMRSNTAGAGNAPIARYELVCKWDNTSSQITNFDYQRSAGNWTAGQIKVWGSN
jgi:hypothetical protein